MPTKEMHPIVKQLFVWSLIGSCSFSLGYGYSQQSMGNALRECIQKVGYMESKQEEIKFDLKSDNVAQDKVMQSIGETTNKRIDKIAELLSDLVRQNTELIALLKIQHGMK